MARGRGRLVLLLTVVLPVVLLLVIIYAGLVDVSASAPTSGLERWLFGTISDRSISRRAARIDVPPVLDGPEMLEAGFRHYHAMCADCHGAPGHPRSVVGEGLNPAAPDMVEEAEELSPAELFWVTKNGIRMTGMPAFGRTHTDDEIWEIVGFVRRLPEISPAEYAAMVRAAEQPAEVVTPPGEPVPGEEAPHRHDGRPHRH